MFFYRLAASLTIILLSLIFPQLTHARPRMHHMQMVMGDSTKAMVSASMPMNRTLTFKTDGKVLAHTLIVINGQSRTTDGEGKATFEEVGMGKQQIYVITDGRMVSYAGMVADTTNTITLEKSVLVDNQATISPQLIFGLVFLIGIVIFGYYVLAKAPHQFSRPSYAHVGLALFFVFATGSSLFVLSKTTSDEQIVNSQKSTHAAELATIASPLNVHVYADDQVATVTWDTPRQASSQHIVGYFVRWGEKSTGILTDTKQTIHNTVQIQPLKNGVEYLVQVQSVQGSYENKPNQSEQAGGDTYAVANGNLSLPVMLSVTPTSAKTDAQRSRLTAFFDDFNLPAGAFDETKWNHATTACTQVGEDGQFVNSQFHAHNATRSDCDRDGNVSRPRALFDVSGRTEANPGVIEFDLDGVSQPRDVWYLDLIPADARKNGMPLDVTAHNDLFDADTEDPGRMLRVAQLYDHLALDYYDASDKPGSIKLSKIACPDWSGTKVDLTYCDITGKQVSGISPITEPAGSISVVPNVRRHWVVQYSPQKIKVFINSALMYEAVPPAEIAGVTKFQIHSTLFSYNTGKQFTVVAPTTSMLHWDNFGFTGPAATIVTHNYLDGGATGTTPLISTGTTSAPVPAGSRTTIIPIPDQIGTPAGQARLMFTLQSFGYSTYIWKSTDNVVVNGKTYPFPNPQLNAASPLPENVSTYVPLSTGIFIDPADLKQGNNTIAFKIPSDVLNVHLELDYNKNVAPSYTQPKDVFAAANFKGVITPVMRTNDSYWFVEQVMGLSTTPISVGGGQTTNSFPTAGPTVSNPTAVPTISIPTVTPRPTLTPLPSVVPALRPSATPLPTLSTGSGPTAIPTSSTSTGSRIIIYAAGTPAGGIYPSMDLLIRDVVVKSWTGVMGDPYTRQVRAFVYDAPSVVHPADVKVAFTNDAVIGRGDRNLFVDKITIDAVKYESENPAVYSTGTWSNRVGCSAGNKQSEWLACNGYFHY